VGARRAVLGDDVTLGAVEDASVRPGTAVSVEVCLGELASGEQAPRTSRNIAAVAVDAWPRERIIDRL